MAPVRVLEVTMDGRAGGDVDTMATFGDEGPREGELDGEEAR